MYLDHIYCGVSSSLETCCRPNMWKTASQLFEEMAWVGYYPCDFPQALFGAALSTIKDLLS